MGTEFLDKTAASSIRWSHFPQATPIFPSAIPPLPSRGGGAKETAILTRADTLGAVALTSLHSHLIALPVMSPRQ